MFSYRSIYHAATTLSLLARRLLAGFWVTRGGSNEATGLVFGQQGRTEVQRQQKVPHSVS